MNVSAIIPAYNRRKYIFRAVDSVLAQTVPVDEIIVVDDGSTDGTADAVEAHYGERVRVLRQVNTGVSGARQTGIRAARGEWIAFLDSDDEWTPERNQILVDAANRVPADVGWVFGDLRLVSDAGEGPTLFEKHGLTVPESLHVFADALTVQFPFQFCMLQGSFIRRKVLLELDCFSNGLRSDDDLLAGFQVACHYRMAAVPSVVGKYFRTSDLAAGSVVVNGVHGPDHYRSRILAFGLVAETVRRQPWNKMYAAEVRDLAKLLAGRGQETRGLASQQFRYGGFTAKGIAFFCAALLGRWGIQMWTRAAESRRRMLTAVLFLACICAASTCRAADLVMVEGDQPQPFEQEQIRRAADFLGLELRTIRPGTGNAELLSAVQNPRTRALLADQESLTKLDRPRTLSALQRPGGSIPLLVFGVDPGRNAAELTAWSGGAVSECRPLDGARVETLRFETGSALTGPLSGWTVPAVTTPTCSLRLGAGAEIVISARRPNGEDAVLVGSRPGAARVFFMPGSKLVDTTWIGDPRGLSKAFSSLAPFLLVLSHAAGEYRWHAEQSYANLTIDDAWLTEPFGGLNYHGLLREMQKHRFHTTIAFIPWNFDRSNSEVADLVRAHAESFSFCIHGNNHAHREFGDYGSNSLAEQVAGIKQAVARMERFHALTGIGYDRFMVFPHAVAPEATFAALRKYNFLGTANSQNVPLGNSLPADPLFLLRPYTLRYANFLSFFRYSAEDTLPAVELAIHSFLGNPLLFYGHEGMFGHGVGAFDETADLVNKIQPQTRWASLGEVAKHLYLVRRRDEREFDVRLMASDVEVENTSAEPAIYYVQQSQPCPSSICSFLIDGQPREADGKVLRVEIPARHTMRFAAIDRNDLDPARERVGKGSLYVRGLRLVSDFRDLYLSRVPVGRSLVRAYYEHNWNGLESSLENGWPVGAGIVGVLAIFCAWRASRKNRSSRIAPWTSDDSARSDLEQRIG